MSSIKELEEKAKRFGCNFVGDNGKLALENPNTLERKVIE